MGSAFLLKSKVQDHSFVDLNDVRSLVSSKPLLVYEGLKTWKKWWEKTPRFSGWR